MCRGHTNTHKGTLTTHTHTHMLPGAMESLGVWHPCSWLCLCAYFINVAFENPFIYQKQTSNTHNSRANVCVCARVCVWYPVCLPGYPCVCWQQILQQFSKQRRKNETAKGINEVCLRICHLWHMTYFMRPSIQDSGSGSRDAKDLHDLGARIITAAIIKISRTKLGRNAIESFALGNLTPSSRT